MANVSVLNTDAGVSGKTLITAEGTHTITGLHTFDRDPNGPFAVSAGSAVVSNLDSDKLDGQEGTYYLDSANLTNLSGMPISFTSPSYSASNFAAVGGGTWTVASGDVTTYGFFKTGKQVTMIVYLNTTTVTGTVSKLQVNAGGYTAAKASATMGMVYDNSGTVASLAVVEIAAAGTVIDVQLAAGGNYTASADNTYVRFQLTFESTT